MLDALALEKGGDRLGDRSLAGDVEPVLRPDLVEGPVERYELPNLLAFNFFLRHALGGGGTLSLRVDHQGKTLAQGLLTMELDVPEDVLSSVGA